MLNWKIKSKFRALLWLIKVLKEKLHVSITSCAAFQSPFSLQLHLLLCDFLKNKRTPSFFSLTSIVKFCFTSEMKLMLHVLQSPLCTEWMVLPFHFSCAQVLFYKIHTCCRTSYKQDNSSEERPEVRRCCFLRPMWREKETEYLYLISAPNDRFYSSVPIVVHIMHGYSSLQVLHQNFIRAEEDTYVTKGVWFFYFPSDKML